LTGLADRLVARARTILAAPNRGGPLINPPDAG
jgi:hypothetical protein